MHKYLSAILFVCLVVAVGYALYQKHKLSEETLNFQNKIANLEGLVKEKEGLYSQKAIQLEDAEKQILKNKEEIEQLLKSRKEQAAILTELMFKLKTKEIEIEDAKQSIKDKEGNDTEVSQQCQDCLKDLRLRVDFEKIEDSLKVSGYTLTNPAYANVKLEWIKDLKLSLVISKDKEGRFRAYIDTENSDIALSKLNFIINQDALEYKWYEKLALSGSLNVGQGLGANIGVGYEFTEGLNLGPNLSLYYDGKEIKKMYGVTTQWYPFR